MTEVAFEDLKNSDLIVDMVYKGGTRGNLSDEVLSKLMPRCENIGGFRKVMRQDDSKLPAYIVLYTSMQELEWPDYLESETGIFRYYGDNRTPGHDILDTHAGGNRLLEWVFGCLNSGDESIKDIPPFFIFKKIGIGRDVQFLGLAAPGNPHISPDKDLVAFWRSLSETRFQNYEAYFTILNTREPVRREWLNALVWDHDNSDQFAPEVWKNFTRKGRNGIIALKAPKIDNMIPGKYAQLQTDNEGKECLEAIRSHYQENAQGFEMCAKDIVEKMDERFQNFSLTRPWRDGGRDAIGYYMIGSESNANPPLRIDCALEAKCYSEKNSVGVKQMSRLISRIRYRQFGIMVTTSYVDNQAYKEVLEDDQPVLIITATDIAHILRRNSVTSSNIEDWMEALDEEDAVRMSTKG